MSDVSFDEEKLAEAPLRFAAQPRAGLSGSLVRMGIAGNVFIANILLIIASIAMAAGAIFVVVMNQPQTHLPTEAELELLQQMQNSGRTR